MSKVASSLCKHYLTLIKSGQGFESVLRNVNIVHVDDGVCKAEFTVDASQANAFGNLHGGFSATLVDVISGLALLSHSREGAGVSININLSYLKGASIGDDIIVEAKTVRAGKSMGFLDVEIKNKKTGDILVTGTHTKYYG